ncbi:MAG: hypothetical protein ABID54_09675, partial [Pseudomonadota bacterium]
GEICWSSGVPIKGEPRKGHCAISCCPNSFERSLKGFLPINLGEAKDERFQLSDPPQAGSFDIAWSKP